MINRRLQLVLLLLTLKGIAFSQNDFRSGYIVTQENDTLHGLINLRSNYQNSRSCEFKNSKETDSREFIPEDIKCYRIENSKYYITKDVDVKDKKQKLFLEYLVDGIVDLYYLKELTGDYYFIEKEGSMHQLSNDEMIIIRNGVKYSKNSNAYIGTLNYLFSDGPGIQNEIKNTPFSYKQLISLTKNYHNLVCAGQECIDYSRSVKLALFLEPEAGFSLSQLNFRTSGNHDLDLNPVFGVRARVVSARSHYRWNLITGISFSKIDFSGEFKNSIYDNTFLIELNSNILNLPLGVEYSFPLKKIQPYFFACYNSFILLNSEYALYDYYKNQFYDLLTPIPSKLRRYYMGLLLGTGIRYNFRNKSNIFINISGGHNIPGIDANYILDDISITNLSVKAGFSFSVR